MLGGDFSQDLAANVERDSRDSQGGSLSGEIIALIVAASVSVVGALGVIFYFYYRRRGGAHRRAFQSPSLGYGLGGKGGPSSWGDVLLQHNNRRDVVDQTDGVKADKAKSDVH